MKKEVYVFCLFLILPFWVSAGETYYIVHISDLNADSTLSILSADEYTACEEYIKQEIPLLKKACSEIVREWPGILKKLPKKIPFPREAFPQPHTLRKLAEFPSKQQAQKRIQKIKEEIREKSEVRFQQELRSLKSRYRWSLNDLRMFRIRQKAADAIRREIMNNITEQKREDGLGPFPSGESIKDTPEETRQKKQMRVEKAILKGTAFLVAFRRGNAWPGENGSTPSNTAAAGIAFLAADPSERTFKPLIKGIADNMKMFAGEQPFKHGFTNWYQGFAGVFLAEYYAHFPRPDIREILFNTAGNIAKTQLDNGCWKHGYGPKTFYELNGPGVFSLAALGLAHTFNCPDIAEAVKKGVNGMGSRDGKVGYRQSKNYGVKGGMPPGTAWAHFCCDQEGAEKFRNLCSTTVQNIHAIPDGFKTKCLHFLWGALGARMHGEECWNTFWDIHLDTILSRQNPDGSFNFVSEGAGEESCGPAFFTACYVTVLAIPRNNLKGLFKISPLQGQTASARGRKSWLGIQVRICKEGAAVSDTAQAGPAIHLGLGTGTIIISINGTPAASAEDIKKVMDAIRPGSSFSLTILSDNGKQRLKLYAPARPVQAKASEGWL